MQIHELNNYSGELNSGAFVAVDNGNDTGKLSITQLLADTNNEIDDLDTTLNARIDNIIAGGAAPSEAEIIDARLGASDLGSKSYPSLGESIRGQVSDLFNDITFISDRAYDAGMSLYFERINGSPTKKWFGVAPSNGLVCKVTNDSSISINVIGRANNTESVITFLADGQTKTITINDDYEQIGVYMYADGNGYLSVYGPNYEDIDLKIKGEISDIYKPLNVTWESGSYVKYSDGAFATSGGSQNTGFVDCSNISRLKISSYISNSGATLAFYDADKHYMQSASVQGNGDIQNINVAIPAGAQYFIVSHYGTGDKSVIIYTKLSAYINNLIGKKVMFFGDSITANDSGYRKYLLENTGMILSKSFAINGATLTNLSNTVMDGNPTQSSNNTVPNQVQKMLNGSYETPDIVIVSAGTNDDNSHFVYEETQFESGGSYIDVDTCNLKNASGAMRWIYEKIMSVYPNAAVYFATPIQSATPTRTFTVLKNKRNIIAENVERMSLKLIDAFYKSGIYSRYEANGSSGKYLSDGLHTNDDGAQLLARCYEKEISESYF